MKSKTVLTILTLVSLAISSLAITDSSLAAFNELRLTATLAGANEVPPTITTSTGIGTFVIDTTANTLRFNISVQNLSATETAAHIHGPAEVGTNAGVLFPLPLGNLKTGIWNYPEAVEADIVSGRTYVNVHTSAFPGGEIRGQIVPQF